MNMPDREPRPDDADLDLPLRAVLQRGALAPPPVSPVLAARILSAAELPLRRRARDSARDPIGVLATWARIVLPVAAAAGIALAISVPTVDSASNDTPGDTWSLIHSSDGSDGRLLVELVVSLDGAASSDAEW